MGKQTNKQKTQQLNSAGETGKMNLYTGIYGRLRKDRNESYKMVYLRFLCKGHILLLLQANINLAPRLFIQCLCISIVSDAIYLALGWDSEELP